MTFQKVRKSKFVLVIFACVCWLAIIHLTNNGRSAYYERLELSLLKERFYELDKKSSRKMQGGGGSLELLDVLRRDLPNAPVDFWYVNYHESQEPSPYCVQYPSIFDLRIYNEHWQTFEHRDTLMQLYAAYYDDRPGVENGPVVRVLAMTNKLDVEFPRTFCHLWFGNGSAPAVVPVTEFKSIWLKGWGTADGLLYPHLLTCHLGERHRPMAPQAVSIANAACGRATNNLRVHYSHPEGGAPKHEFGVCVKNMNYPREDISGRLIEWLELMRLLGAHKVFIYVLSVHQRVQDTLDLYQREGFVELLRINQVPSAESGGTSYKRLNEVINYNDCLYRHLHSYEFLAGVDIDEVIMPLGQLSTWHDIVARFRETNRNCTNGYVDLCFRHVYFPVDEQASQPTDNLVQLNESESRAMAQEEEEDDDDDDDLQNFHFLSTVLRFAQHSSKDLATKCFHNTSAAVTLHNHYSLAWLKNVCRPVSLDPDLAQLQHYRKVKNPKEMQLVEDSNIWRYKDKLVVRTKEFLQRLHSAATW